MYGFLTTGGSLSNTVQSDVVLRTTSLDSTIALGNSNDVTGALYIQGNNVGLHCLPVRDYALKVQGNVLFENAETIFKTHDAGKSVSITNNRISLSTSYLNVNNKETAFLDTSGIIRNNVVITNTVQVPQIELTYVFIGGVERTTVYDDNDSPLQGFKVKIPSRFREDFPSLVKLLLINRCMFNMWRITDVEEYIQLDISYYLKEQESSTLPFAVGDYVSIQLLFDIKGEEENYAKLVNVYRRCVLQEYSYSNNYGYSNNVLTVHFEVENANDEFYQEGLYYIINTSTTDYAVSRIPNHLLKLIRKIVVEQNLTVEQIAENFNPLPKQIILTFEPPDKSSPLPPLLSTSLINLFPSEPKTLFLYVVDAYIPPRIIEGNVGVGYYTNSSDGTYYYCLNDTDIVKNSSQKIIPELGDLYTPELISTGLSYIVLGDQGEKRVINHYQTSASSGTVVVNTGPIRDTEFVIRRQTISYEYIALPIIIKEAQRLDFTTLRYVVDITIEGAFDNLVKFYQGKFAYIMDAWSNAIWTLSSISISSEGRKVMIVKLNNFYGNVSELPHILQPRTVFVVPFKFFVLTKLGSDTSPSYVPTTLGIGTNNVRDTLTVAGTASFLKEISINDSESMRQMFKITYSNDVFDLNKWLEIKPTTITLNKATEISGSITATDIHKASDARIKRIVSSIRKRPDIERIKDLKIHTFSFCNDEHAYVHRGVIAQELQRSVPEAVHTTHDERVIECINTLCEIDEMGRLILQEKSMHCVKNSKHGLLDLAILPKSMHQQVQDINECRRVKVTEYFKCPETSKYILDVEPPLDPMFKHVYIVGVWDKCLTVNYEYLYMMGLSVIKDLSTQMQTLKMEVESLKSSLSVISA